MTTHRARDRGRERIQRLSRSGLDCESIQREVVGELQRVIGFDRWCLPNADPETLLPGHGIADHDYGPGLPRALELEYSGEDFAAKHDVACTPRRGSSLVAETGGDLARSPRWDQVLRPVGIGDLAAVACRDASGCWGWFEAYRNADEPAFWDLLVAAGTSLAGVMRRSFGIGGSGLPDAAEDSGVLVLNRDLAVVSRTEAAARWLAALPLADLFAAWNMLPAVVYPAAARARAGAFRGAHATLPGTGDGWVRIETAKLDGEREGDIVVTMRAASPSERLNVACRAHGLTSRETDVLAALLHGADTREVARSLHLSEWTVQDHLKSVFTKVGVHSRREALARLTGS